MEWWTRPDEPRMLMVLPAWFATYRPRLGLADTLATLADESDTMMALCLPADMAQVLIWKNGKLDGAASIRRWMGTSGRLVTFGAYTAELELDIVSGAGKDSI